MQLGIRGERRFGWVLMVLALTVINGSRVASAQTQTLTISGTPATVVMPGDYYYFVPTVTGNTGTRTLRFGIKNKPSWAYFNKSTGSLVGKPTTSNIGVYSNITISVSNGVSTAKLPTFSITVSSPATAPAPEPSPTPEPTPTPTPTTNTPPTISGTPPTTGTEGGSYSFQPTASDANGDTLTFSVQNLPGFAYFSTSTGKMWGDLHSWDVGTWKNIIISVSDGTTTVSLPAFSITVYAAGTAPAPEPTPEPTPTPTPSPTPTTGSVTLNWAPPLQNTDGTSLTNLAGYKIIYGTSASALTNTVTVPTAGVASYTIDNLASGTWYFEVSSYNSAGTQSAPSNVVSVTIP
jgi:hypothetical protein